MVRNMKLLGGTFGLITSGASVPCSLFPAMIILR